MREDTQHSRTGRHLSTSRVFANWAVSTPPHRLSSIPLPSSPPPPTRRPSFTSSRRPSVNRSSARHFLSHPHLHSVSPSFLLSSPLLPVAFLDVSLPLLSLHFTPLLALCVAHILLFPFFLPSLSFLLLIAPCLHPFQHCIVPHHSSCSSTRQPATPLSLHPTPPHTALQPPTIHCSATPRRLLPSSRLCLTSTHLHPPHVAASPFPLPSIHLSLHSLPSVKWIPPSRFPPRCRLQ